MSIHLANGINIHPFNPSLRESAAFGASFGAFVCDPSPFPSPREQLSQLWRRKWSSLPLRGMEARQSSGGKKVVTAKFGNLVWKVRPVKYICVLENWRGGRKMPECSLSTEPQRHNKYSAGQSLFQKSWMTEIWLLPVTRCRSSFLATLKQEGT